MLVHTIIILACIAVSSSFKLNHGKQRAVPTIADEAGFEQQLSCFLNKDDQLALLLDFDGTLAPLRINPVNNVIEPKSDELLHRLVDHPNVFLAIISGRGAANVADKVGLPNITYAGNHGLEIDYANGTQWKYQLSDATKKNHTQLVNMLSDRVARDGAWVEDKLVSLTFHYSEAPQTLHAKLLAEAMDAIESFGFIGSPGHLAIEAKPRVQWNKGEAALKILRGRFGDDWATNTRVLFAGDDTTDEDAMRALQGRARCFRVHANADVKTFADYRLPSTKTVTTLLNWLENRV